MAEAPTTEEVVARINEIIQSAEMETASSPGFENAKTRLESMIKILEDFIDTADETLLQMYHRCVSALRKLSSSLSSTCTSLPVNIPTTLNMCGHVGRPKVLVSIDFYELLREAGYTLDEIATIFGTSRSTLWRRLKENNISVSKYSQISDQVLDYLVEQYQNRNPNCGQSILQGYLTSIGIIVQRSRIRDSLSRIDPLRQRLRWHQPITRRRYHVPGANSLWHIDGHHSLIRWRFVIHGGIDGYSRMVVFLKCSTNNRSSTVMTEFYNATVKYGIPSRVRSDRGGENVLVCQYMIIVRGTGRGSHLAGSSVRNQRIERLWRDVYRCVASTYHILFHSMEDIGVLDPDSDVDLFTLHCLYLPRINSSLEEFAKAWNRHPLRTENNWSPHKIWTNSVVRDLDDISNIHSDEFGIDEFGPIPEERLHTVNVPETLEDFHEEARDIFVMRLNEAVAEVFTQDIDPHVEFIQARLILSELIDLEDSD